MLPILVSVPLDNHGKHNLLIKDECCHCDMTHWLVNPIVKLKMWRYQFAGGCHEHGTNLTVKQRKSQNSLTEASFTKLPFVLFDFKHVTGHRLLQNHRCFWHTPSYLLKTAWVWALTQSTYFYTWTGPHSSCETSLQSVRGSWRACGRFYL